MGDDNSSDFVYYHYTPSIAAAFAVCAVFACSTGLHTWQLFWSRSWFLLPLLIGAFCETVGFAARGVSATQAPDDYSLGPYIIQSILTLIAPALFAASIYMVFGYIILLSDGDRYSLIREKLLTKLFVLGDIVSFLVQSSGASFLAKKDPDAKDAGKFIIVGGLVLQLIFFGFFMVVSLVFHFRIRREPTALSQRADVPWLKHLWIVYFASALIMVRSVFRVVEYVEGQDGYLLGNEVWLYVFDAALMLNVVLLFNFVHPSEVKNMLRGRKAMKIFRTKPVLDVRGLEKDTALASQGPQAV